VRSHHSRHDHVGQSISLVRLHVLQAVEQLRSQVLRHGRLVLVAELRHGVELQVLEVRRVLHIIAVESPTVLQVRMLHCSHLRAHIRRRTTRCKHLLQLDQLRHPVDHLLHQLHLRETQTLLVRHVELGPHRRRVLACRPARLQVEAAAHIIQQSLVSSLARLQQLVELCQADHHRGAKSSAQVGRTGAQESELLAPHQLRAVGLSRLLHGIRQIAETRKHRRNVAALLH